MMNYVITGGAGFIGSHLAKALLENGHHIKIIDNLSTGTKSNLDDMLKKISFHDNDVLDYQGLEKLVQDTDGIFHLAALTSVPESYLKQKEYHDVNVKGTENIFNIA